MQSPLWSVLSAGRHDRFMRWLGDTRLIGTAPSTCNANTKEQAGTRKSTDQDGYNGGVEVGRCDRRSDRESANATKERAKAILG